jgi:cytidine deaminase
VNYKQLVSAAQKAKQHSFSPYSHFRVGAAVLTKTGKIYSGCNIESSSFSLTVCAERTALFKAISEARHKFKAIAIATDLESFVSPCGACRQVISDLAGNIEVILVTKKGKMKIVRMSDLLPIPFSGKVLTF